MRLPIAQLLLTAALFGSALGCSALDPIELPLPGEFLRRADDDQAFAEPEIELAEQVVRGVQWNAAQVPGYQEVKQQLAAYHLEPVDHPLTAAECACTAAAQVPDGSCVGEGSGQRQPRAASAPPHRTQ